MERRHLISKHANLYVRLWIQRFAIPQLEVVRIHSQCLFQVNNRSWKKRHSVPTVSQRILKVCSGTCITGMVVSWVKNPAFYEDFEEPCEEADVAAAFGNEWAKIKQGLPANCRFV